MSQTRLGYLALKKEATAGTAVVPTHSLRFMEGDLEKKIDNIISNPIQNNRWGALSVVRGKETCEGNFKFQFDAVESGYIMYGALGADSPVDTSSATDGSVYTHTMTIAAATLPSFTVEQGKGSLSDTTNNRLNYRVMRGYGCQFDGFTMRGSDNAIELEANIKALGIFDTARLLNNESAGSNVVLELETVEGLVASETVNIYDITPQNEAKAIASLSGTAKTITIGTLSNSYTVANYARVMLCPITPSYSIAQQLMSFAMVNFQFGATLTAAGSAAEENVENWEITFSNKLDARPGSIRPGYGTLAARSASLKLKFQKYFASRADADAYFMAQRKACIITITNNVIISATDTGNTKYGITLKFSDLRFTAHEMKTGTDELYAYNVEAEALYDTGDSRAIQILMYNAVADYTA